MSDSGLRVELVQTCGACPEQYNAYIDGEKLGYLRLRHGSFRAEYRGRVVYRGDPDGAGCFTDEEREVYLQRACQAILGTGLGDKCFYFGTRGVKEG